MHPKLEEIMSALRADQSSQKNLEDFRSAVADILKHEDYRRLYVFTDSLAPYIQASHELAFNVAFAPTRQKRDGTITKPGYFRLDVNESAGGKLVGTFEATPLSQD
jgi:3-deoxy-D-arabino-heptulosonate 7-phosphate (DAHP) synthase